MLLRDSLDDAVADISADLQTLTTASRRQGLAIRRRRRALASVGAVAASTMLVVGGYSLVPSSDGGKAVTATDQSPPSKTASLSGATAPITGAGTAAALAAAVEDVANGTLSRFQGDAADHEALAALLFKPANGSGPAGQVFINLQPAAMAGKRPYTCDGYLTQDLVDCAVTKLPDDTTLRTYRENGDTEFGAASQRVVAEVIHPRQRLRVIVSAMNTNPWAGGRHRDQTVLTSEQLTQIASQPWWSRTDLPVEYIKAGKALDLYEG
jgi:hypothetical protein